MVNGGSPVDFERNMGTVGVDVAIGELDLPNIQGHQMVNGLCINCLF